MLDPDALLQVLIDAGHPLTEARYLAGQILALVRPAAIDRDALRSIVLWVGANAPLTKFIDEATDRILALVRPVAGVWVSPDECGAAAAAIRIVLRLEHEGWTERRRDVAWGLVARLEAAS